MLTSTLPTQDAELEYVTIDGTYGTQTVHCDVYARVIVEDTDDGPVRTAELAKVDNYTGDDVPQAAIDYALSVIETGDPGVA